MSRKYIIYAVDDEKSIRELYDCALESSGFDISCFENGEDLFSCMEKRIPDLIILDIMLNGMDGFSILEKIRKDSSTAMIPIIMVSAKGEEISKVKGLNLGADDYISKPFGILELIARINANLRRHNTEKSVLSYKDIEVNDRQHEICIRKNPVTLTLKEYDLLKLLVVNAPNVVTRDDILSSVWGDDYFGETRTLDIHVASLRKIILESDAKINTVRGVGYFLK